MTKKSREKFKVYKNVFDEFTLRTLFKLSTKSYFDELLMPVKIGKESNIFLADTKKGYAIVKIYRLQSCNFNKMFSYIKADPRFMNIKNKKRLVIFNWVKREYSNLLLARKKVNVPEPIAFLNHVLVMESIGKSKPAEQLKDKPPKNVEKFFNQVMKNIRNLVLLGLVHSDLSEHNILNYREKPYFIDFSQATTIGDSNFESYLKRDLTNIAKFFKKFNIKMNLEKELEKLIAIKKEIIK